ncbi:MAG TPA: M81 family metallopeptidase [Candidatus Latescibacteria bacterium]|nr:microcystin degradation protein MlrC [Gemmatimonadaceae bacterium]MDP6018102.1 M81 family metallopeptidase [Candidatus Latescibacterota bacterium]HJP33838.1 M81 family metallopeptidase [Candidatus Latescibacterota bacterium]
MLKILIAECKQEISSFNPVETQYEAFVINRGDQLFAYHRGIESEIGGALDVFSARDDVDAVPVWGARAGSAGPLAQDAFERLAAEFTEALAAHKDGADAFYFCLHGAMGATSELDPEGFLLREARKILGPHVPIVISLDLHGILTERMLEHCDALTIYHTYPHVDLADTGMRATQLLLRMLDEGLEPVIARVVVPALVRGDELKTETGVFGESIRRAQELERTGAALAAGMMIGNPFTDVPELCSQSVVVTDGNRETAAQAAVDMAAAFWEKRELMQAPLIPVDEAIAAAQELEGTAIFADAADATSSGATGDSNAILAALLEAGYSGKVLLPIVDPPAAERAVETGVGQSAMFRLGGACDPRFSPVELEATVAMLAAGPYHFESWGTQQDGGDTAVLQAGQITIVVTSRPVYLFDRSLFLAHGRDPQNFDLVVVKSPHCQERFFVAWAAANFNIDAPGSTSANLRSLGHTICRRPVFPLDEGVVFTPAAQLYPATGG